MKTTTRPLDSLRPTVSNLRAVAAPNQRPHGRPWNLVRGLLCFAVILSCVPTTALAWPASAPAPTSAQACAEPSDEKIKAFNDALAPANTALGKLRAANAPLTADANAINAALKAVGEAVKKDNFADAVTQFANVVTALKAGVSTAEGRLAATRGPLREAKEKRDVLFSKYSPDFSACAGVADPPAKVSPVLNEYDKFDKDYKAQLQVKETLEKAVKAVSSNAEEFLKALAKKAREAAALNSTLNTHALRSTLAEKLPGLAAAMSARRRFEPVSKDLAAALDPKFPDVKEFSATAPNFEGLFAGVDGELKRALAKLPGWAQQAARAAEAEQATTQAALVRASRDPYHNATELLALATLTERARKEFDALSKALETMLSETSLDDVPGSVLPEGFPAQASDLSDSTSILQRMTARLAGTLQMLRSEVPVDKSTWTMASVDLFYFDNVERIMRVLSPNTRLVSSFSDQNFQTAARLAREKLFGESQTLEQAETEVSDRRAEVGKIQERIRQATLRKNAAVQTQRIENAAQRRTVQKAEERERTATQRRKDLEARQAVEQRRVNRAQAAVDEADDDDPDLAELRRRRDAAAGDLDRATLLADEARAEEERAVEETAAARTAAGVNTDADEDVATLRTELNTAQNELTGALTRRSSATDRHRTAMRDAFLAAQTENFAFAQARDNAPFLTNMPAPTPTPAPAASPTPNPAPTVALPDSDPVSRVLLFAYPDTRTIFIRGARGDIDLVRQIISEFDRPQGQAMMTLRTMEVNSDRNNSRRALGFLKDVDKRLLTAQAQVEGALTTLRDRINAEVKRVADAKEAPWQAKLDELAGKSDAASRHERTNLQLLLSERDDTERETFYDEKVLRALGWRPNFRGETVNTGFLKAVIPSPSKTVNLAQALIVLSLATEASRAEVIRSLPRPAAAAGGGAAATAPGRFEAELTGKAVNGAVPEGDVWYGIEFGNRELIVGVEGVKLLAGTRLNVLVDDVKVGELAVAPKLGRGELRLSVEAGERVPPVNPRTRVVVTNQAGETLLAGILSNARPQQPAGPAAEADPFASLVRFVGRDGRGAGLLGFQAKLVEALRFNAIPHVLEVAESKVRLRKQLLDERARISPDLGKAEERAAALEEEEALLKRDIVALESELSAAARNRGGQNEQEQKKMSDQLVALKKRAADVAQSIEELKAEFDKIDAALPQRSAAKLEEINNGLTRLEIDLPALLGWLQGSDPAAPMNLLRERIEQAVDSADSTSALLAHAAGLQRSARSRFTKANESAVNLAFRNYLEQVNRDLTEAYVKPAFREINDRLIKEKLGVGVMQETSILASNRLAARVDPRGSAQLAVGEERNVLEAARQLTSLFGIAGKSLATGATGKVSALAGGPLGAAASTIQTAQDVFNALDQLPRDAQPTVYGIATGNLFQVTPVIDPSGQALRFRFDLVSATQIREPDDTIDPMLPRIERHSVNTEVHLADQEIRLISQFQANSRLGIGTQRSGGIPVLKYIPGVREVPLIGWFVRRGGRAAQTQQSFIFCQTTMYPTLSEVLDVAVQSPTFTGLDTPAQ